MMLRVWVNTYNLTLTETQREMETLQLTPDLLNQNPNLTNPHMHLRSTSNGFRGYINVVPIRQAGDPVGQVPCWGDILKLLLPSDLYAPRLSSSISGGGVHLAALLFPLNTGLLPHLPIPFLCHPSMGPLFCSTWILPVSMELLKVGLQKPKLIREKKKDGYERQWGSLPAESGPTVL